MKIEIKMKLKHKTKTFNSLKKTYYYKNSLKIKNIYD